MAGLPLLVVVGFLLDRPLSEGMYLFGYDPKAVSHIWFLRDQYNYGNLNIRDLHVFELFVWLALLLFVLRVLVGLFALQFFDKVSTRLNALKVSPYKYFLIWLFMGPLAILASINIAGANRVFQFQYILEHSIRAFLCLEAFVFCGGMFFSPRGCCFLYR